jgi:NAD(P)-dependent dehydrogenase (short-subunit alcohol dehydrogenase family)
MRGRKFCLTAIFDEAVGFERAQIARQRRLIEFTAPLYGPYVASKFADFAISNALRLEAHDLGINVTVVCPGYIKTEMTTKPAERIPFFIFPVAFH